MSDISCAQKSGSNSGLLLHMFALLRFYLMLFPLAYHGEFLAFSSSKGNKTTQQDPQFKERSIKRYSLHQHLAPLSLLPHLRSFCRCAFLRHLIHWSVEHQRLIDSSQDSVEIQLHSHQKHHILQFGNTDLLICSTYLPTCSSYHLLLAVTDVPVWAEETSSCQEANSGWETKVKTRHSYS